MAFFERSESPRRRRPTQASFSRRSAASLLNKRGVKRTAFTVTLQMKQRYARRSAETRNPLTGNLNPRHFARDLRAGSPASTTSRESGASAVNAGLIGGTHAPNARVQVIGGFQLHAVPWNSINSRTGGSDRLLYIANRAGVRALAATRPYVNRLTLDAARAVSAS